MADFPHLFSKGRLGRLETPNRIVMAPMVRNYADKDGKVTDKYLAHIKRVALGGVGTMILDATFVSPEGRGFVNQLGIHNDDMIPSLRRIADAAHELGTLVGPQIYHAGRQTSSRVTGMTPVAPSPLPDPMMQEEPQELTTDEIVRIVASFGEAARRTREAGCDFLEIHGAHGYLITQFLSGSTNVRTDEYGGSLEKRMRFLVEIVNSVRASVGDDFPIIVRLSGDEMVENGITPDDTVQIARRLEELGVDALHISAGSYAAFNKGMMIQPMAIDDAPLVYLAERIKAAVGLPVITVGKLRKPEICEDVLKSGKADFVALGREFLADPDWPNKAREGRLDEINHCIACNQGCIGRLFEQKDVWCTVNPETSRELEFGMPSITRPQRVLVIGGGPGGMEAAKVAAEKGHKVTLCEAADRLGGQLICAAAAPHRPGWEELRQYLIREMDRLGVDVRLNTRITPNDIDRESFDLLVIATGARAFRPRIIGIDRDNVMVARDILEGKAEAKGKVVVAGGGCAGAQTAEYLADRGHDVEIIEMYGKIALDAPPAEGPLLLERLAAKGVKITINTAITTIEDDGVIVESQGGIERVPADTVVLCMGSASDKTFEDKVKALAPAAVVIGDALDPRKVTEAIDEGAEAILNMHLVEATVY